MPVNDKQKIIILDINANTKALIDEKLALGYVVLFMVNLQPALLKLLVVYATPDEI